MKFLPILFFCLWSGISALHGDQSVEFKKAVNDFNGALYQKIVAGKSGNVVMSPISVQIAVSMAYMGAHGETEAEMKKSLKYSGYDKNSVSDSFIGVIKELESSDGLKIANKIYVKNGYTIKPKFNEIVAKKFGSAVQNINFAKNVEAANEINQWVESKTNNKIKNLIDPTMLSDDTRMAILNAVHFKKPWAVKFHEESTRKGPFYVSPEKSVQVDFMKDKTYHNYGALPGLNAHAIELSLENRDFKFYIILPDSKTGLAELESKLHQVNLNEALSSLKNQYVKLEIPKFKIENKIDLKEVLQNLGMQRMFTSKAEFGELLEADEDIFVSEVLQKAFIDVNEHGIEAAAATAVLMGFGASRFPPKEELFVADHPFLFVLKSENYNIFMGRVINPQ
jgi:serpin B